MAGGGLTTPWGFYVRFRRRSHFECDHRGEEEFLLRVASPRAFLWLFQDPFLTDRLRRCVLLPLPPFFRNWQLSKELLSSRVFP